MDSSCSVTRRQAWAKCRRQWLTVEETEPQLAEFSNTHTSPAAQLSLQDEIFPEGCSTGKIESWLQRCGTEASQENPSQLTLESLLKAASSFEDDLSLGAEATQLEGGLHEEEFGRSPLLLPPPKGRRKDLHTSSAPQPRLNLPFRNMGHSMTSSMFSSTTNKTASCVSHVLQMCAEDAEETLYHLGFGCEEPQVTARIPARFFSFPSQLKGINFRLFLESQLRRIHEEDPGLSLASRFRQVEVLTAMANAFYSLYSHVSRTPLQKLALPELSSSSPSMERSIGHRFFGTICTEPRSPVERLKDTVSKMCLYTRGSDSTSPHCSPRKKNSLPCVVEMLVRNVQGEGSDDLCSETCKREQAGNDNTTHNVKYENTLQHVEVKTAEKINEHEKTTSAHKQRIQQWSESGKGEGPSAMDSPCQIMVTGWEDDNPVLHRDSFESYTHFMYPGSNAHLHLDQQRYLSPSSTSTSQVNFQLKQANSFDLEEVQSVAEETVSLEKCNAYTLSVTASTYQKCSPMRGDSFQSDSSGYAEEDMQNVLTSTNRD